MNRIVHRARTGMAMFLLGSMLASTDSIAQTTPDAGKENQEIVHQFMAPHNSDIPDPQTTGKLNPMQKSLQAMMDWVDINADMAGAVYRCDKEETTYIEGCTELVLRNWHKATGLPDFNEVEKDGSIHQIPHIRDVVRAAWSKQRAISFMQQGRSPRPCQELIEHEQASYIWKICHRSVQAPGAKGSAVAPDGRIDLQ